MRVRAATALGAVMAGAGIAAAISAGPASAVAPVGPAPGVIAGVRLDHGETAAVANTPLPSMLGIGLLAPLTWVSVPDGSPTPRTGDGHVNATMATIWQDMATLPTGRIAVALVDPAQWQGKFIVVKQYV